MNNEKENQPVPQPQPPSFSPFTVLIVPPLGLIGSSMPLWYMDEPVSALVDVARYGSFGFSAFYIVMQLVLIAVRGRPLFVEKS